MRAKATGMREAGQTGRRAALALCHTSRHASRPSGVRLAVHLAFGPTVPAPGTILPATARHTAGSQFDRFHSAVFPAHSRLAVAWFAQGCAGVPGAAADVADLAGVTPATGRQMPAERGVHAVAVTDPAGHAQAPAGPARQRTTLPHARRKHQRCDFLHRQHLAAQLCQPFGADSTGL
ncbi:hypothetical protein D3C80_1111400 [compost metagenome]